MLIRSKLGSLTVLAVLLVSGCGSSSKSATSTPAGGSGAAAGSGGGGSAGGAALAADATSARTGDIPDNQNFLTFQGASLRFSIVYPEGWTVQRVTSGVTFRDKNNLVRIALSPGSEPTAAQMQAQLAALKRTDPSLVAGTPAPITLRSGPAIKVTYTTESAPNPVTGKRVTLLVDRYALSHSGRVATVDLGTPRGVDNVDAYKKMIASFTWR
jgi:hypothetical protein